MKVRNLFAFALLAIASLSASAQVTSVGDGGTGPYKALHLTAEMVSLSPNVAPGGSVEIGLVISPEEKWHVYWVNAGDAGEPPSIKWKLPAGVTAGPIQFPVPSRIPLGPLMDFGYEDNTAFPVKVSVDSSVKPGPIHLDAKVDWLVCSSSTCLPGAAHMGIDLNVVAGAPAVPESQQLGALGAALKALPQQLPSNAQLSVMGGRTEYVVTLLNTPKVDPDNVEFYPIDQDLIVNSADQDVTRVANGFRIRIPRADDSAKPGTYPPLPKSLHAVIKTDDGEGYEVSAPVVPGDLPDEDAHNAAMAAGAATQAAVGTNASTPGTPKAPTTAGNSGLTALPAIGLAFLGGIILNLMPCVFPVLFLKGLALVQSSGEERARMRSHGLVYTLGILVSFWAIVAALLILRAYGSHIGWGFQLQSPVFIAILASFLFLFAMSLAGQFDIGLSLTSAGGELAKKEGYAGSFFTGVLATVVATPCTAPLMGAAIGYALAQPPIVTFAVFTALGLGLAVPYLLLTLQPAWTRILPRPGAWMETLKQLTAIPLFLTVIWLTWVFGRLHITGESGAESDNIVYLLICFLILAVAGWVLHRWPGQWKSAVVAIVIIILGLEVPLSRPTVVIVVNKGGATQTSQSNLTWQPYSQAALDAARAAGHPVFIDFTAAWCLSCQVNEKLVLHSADVEQQLSQKHFTLLRADWTQYSPDITAQLASLNRSGVPTYVIYPATGSADVLPELLTKEIVLNGIKADTR